MNFRAWAHLCLALVSCNGALAIEDSNIIQQLEARLSFAGQLLGQSEFIIKKQGSVVECPCEKYCTGQCFSTGCIVCNASTWNFPGGEDECYSPGPLGNGLLCEVNRTTGMPTEIPCCNPPGTQASTCTLEPNSCCETGDCSKCPSYKQDAIFKTLKGRKRKWNSTTNVCVDI